MLDNMSHYILHVKRNDAWYASHDGAGHVKRHVEWHWLCDIVFDMTCFMKSFMTYILAKWEHADQIVVCKHKPALYVRYIPICAFYVSLSPCCHINNYYSGPVLTSLLFMPNFLASPCNLECSLMINFIILLNICRLSGIC